MRAFLPVIAAVAAITGAGCGSSEPETAANPNAAPLTKEQQIAEIQKKEMPASQKAALIDQIKNGQGRR